MNKYRDLLSYYNKAQLAKLGEIVHCPCCHKPFIKKYSSNLFCNVDNKCKNHYQYYSFYLDNAIEKLKPLYKEIAIDYLKSFYTHNELCCKYGLGLNNVKVSIFRIREILEGVLLVNSEIFIPLSNVIYTDKNIPKNMNIVLNSLNNTYRKLAIDYYMNDFSLNELIEKYDIHLGTMNRTLINIKTELHEAFLIKYDQCTNFN